MKKNGYEKFIKIDTNNLYINKNIISSFFSNANKFFKSFEDFAKDVNKKLDYLKDFAKDANKKLDYLEDFTKDANKKLDYLEDFTKDANKKLDYFEVFAKDANKKLDYLMGAKSQNDINSKKKNPKIAKVNQIQKIQKT